MYCDFLDRRRRQLDFVAQTWERVDTVLCRAGLVVMKVVIIGRLPLLLFDLGLGRRFARDASVVWEVSLDSNFEVLDAGQTTTRLTSLHLLDLLQRP